MFGPKPKLALAALAMPFAMALSGCATTATAPTAEAAKTTDELSRAERYVYQVNRAADKSNVRVIWVNPPRDEGRSGLSYSLQATVGDEDAN